MKRFYLILRDLHLYFGLFLCPFVLVFATSVIFLVHSWVPGGAPPRTRTAANLTIPAGLDQLNGRALVDALRGTFHELAVNGEIGFVRNIAKDHRLVTNVSVPGRETTVDLNLATHSAIITERITGASDATVFLHKMPGPHNANIRVNSFFMAVWRWFADATAYLLLFISASGIYLWAVLRSERRIGLTLLAAGAFSFFGLIYAISH